MPRIRKKKNYTRKYVLILLLPGLILLVAVVIFPFLYTLWLSFLRWNLRFSWAKPHFIGLENYKNAILSDPRFYNSLEKTFYLMAGAVPIELLLGLGLALLFHTGFPGKRITMPFFLIPLALSGAVVGLIWGLIFVLTYGPLDYIFQVTGIWRFVFGGRVDLLISHPMGCIITADIWQWTPFFFIILLAALSSVPKDLMEAAMMDGASSTQAFRYIALPMLKPAIAVALIIRMIDVFKTFGVPFVMTKGGPGYASEVVSLYIYNEALQYLDIAYAATLSVIVIVIIIVFLNAFMKAFRFKFTGGG